MVKDGLLFICERCGKEKFVEGKCGEIISTPHTWTKANKAHLCPTCTDLYKKMMNNFFAPEVKRPIDLED